jgi:NADH dehydrogenase/NADH:ubiquinone oxidoreductase subunit G
MHVIIDGKRLAASDGETILDVARRSGIEIPTLCHHDALEPVGACRLCMVEITHDDWQGWKGLVTSCLYPVEDGLKVLTDCDAVRRQRQTVLDLLLARCPVSEVVRELAEKHGEITYYEPFTDGSKCIMCYLCVRACAAVGCNAIAAVNRGTLKEIAAPFHTAPDACVGCGSCAAICPTGHIQLADTRTAREIWGRSFEFVACGSCGAPVITRAHAAHAAARDGLPEEEYGTCAACKKKSAARRFDQVGS